MEIVHSENKLCSLKREVMLLLLHISTKTVAFNEMFTETIICLD